MGPESLRYEDKPSIDLWLRAIIFGTSTGMIIVGVLWVLGVIPSESRTEGLIAGIVFVVMGAFDRVLFWAVMPTRYQIFEDRLRVKLGGPFAFNIPFDSIVAAEPFDRLFHIGIGLATSFRGRVLIRRKYDMDVTISPSNREAFLEQLSIAMRETGDD